jgi:hypothetical protein
MAVIFPSQSCHECEAEAAGRCLQCQQMLCVEHYPRHAHQPCMRRLALHQADYACYVCGKPVVPEQWSTAIFAHYVDEHMCSGCNRYVCEEHTARRDDHVKIVQDGLRSHRYHLTLRTCQLCAPVRMVGGLIGVAWWAGGLAAVALMGWYLFHG